MLEPPHLFIGKVLSTWPEPPQVMVVSSLSGLNYFQFVQTKLSLFCLYVTSYPHHPPHPPVQWHFIINHKYHSLRKITLCVCQVFSVLFHLLSLLIPFVLPYRSLHTRLNENLCSGMKTVVLVFDFLVCVLCAVIHINRASWKLQHSIVPRP